MMAMKTYKDAVKIVDLAKPDEPVSKDADVAPELHRGDIEL
jgi:hypothetical protein